MDQRFLEASCQALTSGLCKSGGERQKCAEHTISDLSDDLIQLEDQSVYGHAKL